ncbi:hypothetical protein [Streptacidiphilus pinicola]|uniref:hypothetical protein n=1 Tax=Streptacidiphilus pinicola TaxID=2219663 RepID=UPI001057A600|nr:hypothetical protein [Streptacidiphilus pinicola]
MNSPPSSSPSWRRRVTVLAHDTQYQLDRLEELTRKQPTDFPAYSTGLSVAHARAQLTAAREAAARRTRPKGGWYGTDVTEAWSNVQAATEELLRLSAQFPNELKGWGPRVLAETQWHLGEPDPRRRQLEFRLGKTDHVLEAADVGLAAECLRAAHAVLNAKRDRVRSFRNIILLTSLCMALLLAAWAILGAYDVQAGRILGFKDPTYPLGASPTRIDILIVELVGVTSAALVGAVALRNIDGTTQPFMVPAFLMLLKLPTGGISALLGLLLLRGGLVSAVQISHSSAAILAWAAIFGAGQELVTRLVDQKGRTLLQQANYSPIGIELASEESHRP